jgi:hypothetical protein
MDKEMMRALQADAEKLNQLTGEDHTPLFLADCEACDGLGYIPKTIHVYEPGCGFSHPDVEEIPCEACAGNGWFVCEAEGDALISQENSGATK